MIVQKEPFWGGPQLEASVRRLKPLGHLTLTNTTVIKCLVPLPVISVISLKGERRWGGIYPGEVELLKIICLVSTLESE